MYNCDLTDDKLVIYPLNDTPSINYQNGGDEEEEVMYN
jgi:hypothetical protein